MTFRSRLFRGVAVTVLVAAGFVGLGERGLAVQDSEKVLFGPIGVAQHEGVRVNVYATGNPNELPWDFVVRIFNRRGDLVQEKRLQLAPGVTGSVSVQFGNEVNFPVERLGRRTLRAEIVGFNPQPDPPGAYVATLEVVDLQTGGTSILLGGPDTLPTSRQ